MAKIRAKGSPKKSSGPTAPSAIGCILILVVAFAVIGALMFFTISRG